MAIEILTLDVSPKRDAKERMKYIFDCYKNTRPDQSNIFNSIGASHIGAMLDNTGDVDAQKETITTDLRDIYTRYLYTELEISIVFDENTNGFEIDITGVDSDGVTSKLSDTLIFDNN